MSTSTTTSVPYLITSSQGRMWSRSSIKASLLHQGGVIDASAGGSIIELTPTQVLKLFKKMADNDAWASSGRIQPLQAVGTAKSVLQVEHEEVLEGKIDSLMRRLEKMEVEKKEAQAIDLKAAEARSTCEEYENT